MENGASPRLSLAIGIWCCSAKAMSALPRRELPLAPRRDDLDLRVQRIGRELEPHLIVALAGRAMRDRVRAGLPRDLDEALGDERPGDGGAEQILPLIDRVGAEHREHEVAHEFLAHVLDEDVLRLDAHQLRLAPRRLQLLALPEIGGEGDDLAPIGRLQPLEDDGGVEPAGIGEDDFLDFRLGHYGLGELDRPAFRQGRGRGQGRAFAPRLCYLARAEGLART